jgi:hypothetical protein
MPNQRARGGRGLLLLLFPSSYRILLIRNLNPPATCEQLHFLKSSLSVREHILTAHRRSIFCAPKYTWS